MADIEKVKQGCKCCSTDEYKCNECQYWAFGVHNNICTGYVEICADALSVIEELQAEIKRLKEKNEMIGGENVQAVSDDKREADEGSNDGRRSERTDWITDFHRFKWLDDSASALGGYLRTKWGD